MKKFFSATVILVSLAMLMAPVLLVAQTTPTPTPTPPTAPTEPTPDNPSNPLPDTTLDKESVEDIMNAVINWVFAVMVVVGTIFIVLAAFQFVTGGGDPAKVAEARQKLIWAILGFAVAVLARAIQPLVENLLNI